MCVLATTVGLAIVGSHVLNSGSSGLSAPNVFTVPAPSTPETLLGEARAIEGAFERAFDNLDPGMTDREIMLAVAELLRPASGFSGDLELIICQVGVCEQEGDLVVSLRVKYELRDEGSVIERELSRSTVLAMGDVTRE